MSKPGEAELTTEQLQLAYRQLWHRGWPDTLEAALAHPTRGGCIRGLARQMSRQKSIAQIAPPRRLPNAPPVPATPTAPPVRFVFRGPTFDARRAAANDRDD